MSEFLLLPIAFVTSCIAAVVGLGGGMLLIAAMPGLVPASAIIPLHAVTQLASNGSRAMFVWRSVDPSIIPPFLLGAVSGAWAGGALYAQLDLAWLPSVIGVLLLCLTWLPVPQVRGAGQWPLVLLGFYQTGLGMLAGATGPLGAAVLSRRNCQRDWLVGNGAVYMSLNHGARMAAFAFAGFNFGSWMPLLAGMISAGIAGSWLGTRLRRRLPQANFRRCFKVLMTLLALRMVAWPWITDSDQCMISTML